MLVVIGALVRLATARGMTVPVDVTLLTVPVIAVPVPVFPVDTKNRVKVTGPVKFACPAITGWL